jgi:hypothetical protein
LIGTFLAPALLVLYLKPLQSNGFIQPDVSYGGGLVPFYTEMAKQLSGCIVAPLVSMDKIKRALESSSSSDCWSGAPASFSHKGETNTRAIQIWHYESVQSKSNLRPLLIGLSSSTPAGASVDNILQSIRHRNIQPSIKGNNHLSDLSQCGAVFPYESCLLLDCTPSIHVEKGFNVAPIWT